MKNLYVEIHALEPVPANNMNRDRSGRPKTIEFGGTQRAMVSSQCWKRAEREKFPTEMLGYRTRYIAEMVEKEITAIDPALEEETIKKYAEAILNTAGINKDVTFFIARDAATRLAQLALDKKDTLKLKKDKKAKTEKYVFDDKEVKKTATEIVQNTITADIALFGRMNAKKKELNVDAACQFAPAITTHGVQIENDFFSAKDDIKVEFTGEGAGNGSAHLGEKQYVSGTYYRYATVNVRDLSENLGVPDESVVEVVKEHIIDFIESIPKGSINAYDNYVIPEYIYVTITDKQPFSFANAYEKPVYSNGSGFFDKSLEKLVDYAENIYSKRKCYRPKKTYVCGKETALGKGTSIDELLDNLGEGLKEEMSKGE